jgi:hypothetical protein
VTDQKTIFFCTGTPLVYEYTYHEMKIIVDGSFDISDETGKKVHATKGDVFYFPKGSKITFETDDFGLGFFVGQRKEGGAWERVLGVGDADKIMKIQYVECRGSVNIVGITTMGQDWAW